MKTNNQFANKEFGSKELDYAYRIRRALDENLDHIPPPTLQRLESARHKALAVQKKSSPLRRFAMNRAAAGHLQHFMRDPLTWIMRASFVLPAVIVAAGLIGIYQFEEQQRIAETAEIDALVLADELPLSAYVDKGFGAYLAERGE
ncbi:MAG: DUF3619 family protein [Burkholderiaceae bacterium]